jgi:hypothetical protein
MEPSDVMLQVGTVRNPLAWLVSYYRAIHPGAIHIPEVDVLKTLPTNSFAEFIRGYLEEMPGQVGRIFELYPAHNYLRMEDFPANAIELFDSLYLPKARVLQTLSPRNAARKRKPVWSRSLFDAVIEAEYETLERFEYGVCDIHPSSIGVEAITR